MTALSSPLPICIEYRWSALSTFAWKSFLEQGKTHFTSSKWKYTNSLLRRQLSWKLPMRRLGDQSKVPCHRKWSDRMCLYRKRLSICFCMCDWGSSELCVRWRQLQQLYNRRMTRVGTTEAPPKYCSRPHRKRSEDRHAHSTKITSIYRPVNNTPWTRNVSRSFN